MPFRIPVAKVMSDWENDMTSQHCSDSSENICPVSWLPFSFFLVSFIRSEFISVAGADASWEPCTGLCHAFVREVVYRCTQAFSEPTVPPPASAVEMG